MVDPTVICPKCKTEIKLNESLAAPLVEATRREFERQLAAKDEEVAQRQESLDQRETSVKQAERGVQQRVAELVARQVEEERSLIAAEERRKASLEKDAELKAVTENVAELEKRLQSKESKLAEAQQAQAEFMRKQRELDDAMREVDLRIEAGIHEKLSAERCKARNEAEEALRLKMMEKEQTIHSMQQKIDELKQKADQGSQQLQGEVQELAIESLLRSKFPMDSIEAVPKGEFGGDSIQRVGGLSGTPCGTILWESKRTKNWSNAWLGKLRDDQRAARAEVSVLVSQVLPPGVESFDFVEGVWVAHPRVIVPLAMALRDSIIQVNNARITSAGQKTKAELVYQYLTGPRFRQRVEGIVEGFSSMQEDLDKERKVILKQWAKREEQIERVMDATVGMYGDLQGIAGQSILEIEALEFKALEAGERH